MGSAKPWYQILPE